MGRDGFEQSAINPAPPRKKLPTDTKVRARRQLLGRSSLGGAPWINPRRHMGVPEARATHEAIARRAATSSRLGNRGSGDAS